MKRSVFLLIALALLAAPAVHGAARTLLQDPPAATDTPSEPGSADAVLSVAATDSAASAAAMQPTTPDPTSTPVLETSSTSATDAAAAIAPEQPVTAPAVTAEVTPAATPRKRHRSRSAHSSSSVSGAQATCNWPGHCLGDPCTTYNDCDGSMICISGKCGNSGGTVTPPPPPTTCNWPGHCLGDPCTTYNDCDGSMICISGKCGNSGGPVASPTPPPTNLCSGKVCSCANECQQSTCSTATGLCSACTNKATGTACSIGTCQNGVCTRTTQPGQGQCPSGWYEAKLTVYDNWPYPKTNEWVSFSGGLYLGTFAYKSTSSACNQPGEVFLNSWSTPNGQRGSFTGGCHFRHDWVANNRIASVFKSASSPVTGINFNTQIKGKQIRVATIGAALAAPSTAGMLVTAMDTCGDNDCGNCCTNNANTAPSRFLIDLEKNTLKALIPGITGFAATSISYSTAGRAAYQGASFDVGSIGGYPNTVCFRLG